jgi:RNA recognition motif-containing protein
MNIHISNLSLNVVESDLQRLFASFGEIKSVELVRDKLNNRSKGRAFIDMPVEKEGQKAILNLNGTDMMGRQITVSEIRYDPTYSTHSFDSKK